MFKTMALSHSFVHARCEYQSVWYYGIMWRPFSESWMAGCSSGSRANVADVLFHKKSIKIRFPSENRIIPHVNIIYIYIYMTIYDNLFFIQWYEISNADFLPMFWDVPWNFAEIGWVTRDPLSWISSVYSIEWGSELLPFRSNICSSYEFA